MKHFKLSKSSLAKLEGVNNDLVKVVKEAIKLTNVDFGITEGLRTKEKQEKLYREGKSKTMNSKHITGEAVDVLAYLDGHYSWALDSYYDIALAFKQAAKNVGVSLRWGGCWKNLDEIDDPKKEVLDYISKKRAQQKQPFIDAYHFELVK